MRESTLHLLRSPDTGLSLRPVILDKDPASGEILTAALIDDSDGSFFRIEDGIADLSPRSLRDRAADEAFARRHGLQAPAIEGGGAPDATALEQRKFFGEETDRYESEVVQSPFSKVLDATTLGIWAKQTLKPPSLIAEIGAGSGRQSILLASLGHDVVAVDLSLEMLRLARSKLAAKGLLDRVDLVVGIGEAPPLAANAFDAWVIMGSLHHFSHPAVAVAKCCELLKPGGLQFLLEPHRSPLRPVFDWLMKRSQLWHEEANEDPLFTFDKIGTWLGGGGVDARIRTSTFLPPHLFYMLPEGASKATLRWSDAVFGNIPMVQKLGGVIIAEGVKRRAA